MRYPAQGPVTQGFSSAHRAVDIGGPAYFDTPIVAPHDGTITAAGQMGSGTNDAGLAIDVSGGRFKSRMGHNNRILVTAGQQVKEGQQIGTQGFTGYTIPDNTKDGTHCHWVLWDNGISVDGRNYVNQGGNDMPSIVADNEIDQLSWQMFGYGASPEFVKEHRGKESNTFIRFMYNHPAAVAYRKQVAEWRTKAEASGSKFKPYDGLPLWLEEN